MKFAPRDQEEERLIAAIADGDRAARAVYADWLEARGELARAMFLRFDPADLDPAWLASLGWVVVGGFIFRLSPDDRRRGVVPLGFTIGRFDATSGSRIEVHARPQRPVQLGRLIATAVRRGPSATAVVLVENVIVGINAFLDPNSPLPIDLLAPDTGFGGAVNLARPCTVGEDIRIILSCPHPPTGGDSIHVSFALFCEPLTPPAPRVPRRDWGLRAAGERPAEHTRAALAPAELEELEEDEDEEDEDEDEDEDELELGAVALDELGAVALELLELGELGEQAPDAPRLRCGCPADRHIDRENYLAGGAERDGAVCSLGWPLD